MRQLTLAGISEVRNQFNKLVQPRFIGQELKEIYEEIETSTQNKFELQDNYTRSGKVETIRISENLFTDI